MDAKSKLSAKTTVRGTQCAAALREAFAWGLDLRHKKDCPPPASNFQKGKPCKCGRDAMYNKLNAIAFGKETE